MQKNSICFVVGLALALCAADTVEAGNSRRAGTAGAQELRIPTSARGIVLGDGYLADVGGVDALWYNPAGAAKAQGTEAYFSHMNYLADIDKEYVAVVAETGFGHIGASIDVLNIGDIQETTELNPEGTGRIFSPTFTVIGVSYARYLTDAVSLGVTGRYISEEVLQSKAQGAAFDVGVQYRPGWNSLRMGFVLKNFGPTMNFDGEDFASVHQTGDDPGAAGRVLRTNSSAFELPSLFEIGLAYTPYSQGDHTLDAYGAFTNHNFGRDEYGFGAEYLFRDYFALRGGMAANGDDDYNFGPAFGFGFNLPLGTGTLSLDYGRRIVDSYFDNNDMFSLKFAF